MQPIFFSACALVIVTTVMHAGGLAVLLRTLVKVHGRPPTRTWLVARMVIRMALYLILLHMAEIAVWAWFYVWQGCLPDTEAAFYFSGTTYTTIGYGDVVLPQQWRLLGPIEGLTGILMCGLSTGFFFAVLSQIYQARRGDLLESSAPARTSTW